VHPRMDEHEWQFGRLDDRSLWILASPRGRSDLRVDVASPSDGFMTEVGPLDLHLLPLSKACLPNHSPGLRRRGSEKSCGTAPPPEQPASSVAAAARTVTPLIVIIFIGRGPIRRLRPGYDPEQVDAFLDKAEPRLAAMRATDKGAT
jgi:hypothetical protein